MKAHKWLKSFLFSLFSIGHGFLFIAFPITLHPTAFQVDCDQIISHFTQDEDLFLQMLDPVIFTQNELNVKLQLYSDVYDCIPSNSDSDYLQTIRTLAEYFMIFVGGEHTSQEESTLVLVDLARIDDAAIISIREDVGIPPPPGFVYLRTFPSREAMPNQVQKLFIDNNVRGVTVLTRYIAVLASSNNLLESQTMPKTISHELVHSYLNSTIGVENLDSFPVWYHEGMAIHFSGSNEPSCVYRSSGSNVVSECSASPEDYEQYAANFKYLQAEMGEDRFLEVLKHSIEDINPSILYSGLGFSNYENFAVQARKWKKKQNLITNATFTSICAIPLLLLLFAYFWNPREKEIKEPASPRQIHHVTPVQKSRPKITRGLSKEEVIRLYGKPNLAQMITLRLEPSFSPRNKLNKFVPFGTFIEEWVYEIDETVLFIWFSGDLNAPRENWLVLDTGILPKSAMQKR